VFTIVQLPEGTQHPAEGDELQMSVVHNRRTGARRASAVSLVARAADRRQLGQVRSDRRWQRFCASNAQRPLSACKGGAVTYSPAARLCVKCASGQPMYTICM
jgi:hypothetical protein